MVILMAVVMVSFSSLFVQLTAVWCVKQVGFGKGVAEDGQHLLKKIGAVPRTGGFHVETLGPVRPVVTYAAMSSASPLNRQNLPSNVNTAHTEK